MDSAYRRIFNWSNEMNNIPFDVFVGKGCTQCWTYDLVQLMVLLRVLRIRTSMKMDICCLEVREHQILLSCGGHVNS